MYPRRQRSRSTRPMVVLRRDGYLGMTEGRSESGHLAGLCSRFFVGKPTCAGAELNQLCSSRRDSTEHRHFTTAQAIPAHVVRKSQRACRNDRQL